MARACAALIAILDPELIVFGGSIGRREELLTRVKAQLARLSNNKHAMEISKLGGRAALVGAASLGLSHIHATLLADGAPGASITLPPAKLASLEGVAHG